MDLFDLLSRMTKDVKSPDFQLTFSTFFLAITWGLVLVWIFHCIMSWSDSSFVIL